MIRYLHDQILTQAEHRPSQPALIAGDRSLDYGALATLVRRTAAGFAHAGLARHERVAIYLDKRIETVAAVYGAAAAGAVFVPCNPALKAPQVGHILTDCTASVLVTSKSRLDALTPALPGTAVRLVVLVDALPDTPLPDGIDVCLWDALVEAAAGDPAPAGPPTDADVAAIFYTSGSTGRPKGVVLSHRNLVVGGDSVSSYLGIRDDDRILALLPLSFDAGFSQLTTGFHAGATVVLHNYLLPRDIPAVCARHGITGLTCVPPLWMQLLQARWTDEARQGLRYIANTGGRMPRDVLDKLRALFDRATPFLMYGLTEAFRSTYLDPAEIDRRPDSIGKAIPNAEILVVKADGTLAGPGEEGELVHRGPLVALGYWNDPEKTARRFKPAPATLDQVVPPELAVWSGDLVRLDDEGFLYFVGRTDDMIKTSGYRVSPTEVEEAVFASGLVREAAAFGVAHPTLGQEIVVALVPDAGYDQDAVRRHCLTVLPRFMVPARLVAHDTLPRSPNGKIDRKALAARLGAAPATATSSDPGSAPQPEAEPEPQS
ncbi:acyl-CoA ligase (AMP-forming), exosortase A system-associated [Rhodothalassium salexigens]|uniref:acyl-CoA ligase (AMP-forming), exosortase A system-associated n=1 Tax=Rhodothalassium salexigens TaxID=1086 RepID=UPI0019137F29|nr:acyl-CoA ligase (AMP-forming), exosortase A system-associated [Rhodothalassium salexigens]MBK5920184.1 acyl-CoA ligase (AMP-forming), exosortase A system-associated [Rhodothalassium salexigens]